ncbi:Txe/YoeB family addiction module toxin [Marinilabiliaceae bacterium JC017]|nr:Txe/YoeB family addiction module toxin [Marinilabiliaceae bacterium JC017]
MMSYTLEFSETALSDIEKHKKSGDKVVLKKIEKLLNELMRHPTTGTGQPKQLKHNLAGLYSRRINQKHRLVYSINEDVVKVLVLSVWAHYEDK